MNDDNEITVITARCIDMAPVYGDVEKRPCVECGEMTWLSTLWKGKKIDKIICEPCFYKSDRYKNKDYSMNVTEECLEEAKDCIKRHHGIRDRDDNEIKEDMVKIIEDKIGRKLNIIK